MTSQRRDMMKLGDRQGLTASEVARILGVSAATVKRYFDKGILTGWRNPITRRMTIDLESLKTLKRKRKWKWVRHLATKKS